MKPSMVIVRHPGRATQEARACISREVSAAFDGVKTLVVCEGVEMWLLSDDGRVYDLNNSGSFVEGKFKVIEFEGTSEVAVQREQHS